MQKLWGVGAICAGALVVAGCKFSDDARASASAPSAEAPNDAVRDALAKRNFGEAAELAAKAADADPKNPNLRLMQAKAEAQLGNGGNAARALDQAIALGLPNPVAAAQDSAFDPVRQDPEFVKVAARLQGGALASVSVASTQPAEVAIGADGSVRAGDVHLGGNP